MNQSEAPPSGNVCWSFQVSCQTRERDGEGEIKLELKCERARDSDRETTSRAGREETGACHGLVEDGALGGFGAPVF